MKNLLLLGGSHYLLPVIAAAKDLECRTITCDFLEDNIAHRFSDEYHNVSIVDHEAVLALARKLKIDGVMSFACDPGVTTAAYVAERLGLPSAGPYESICILQDKSRFRAFLRAHGFQVPAAYSYSSPDEAVTEAAGLPYPVIVKPVDSAGSKGVSKVDQADQLRGAITEALAFSRKRSVIVEQYIAASGCASDSECFSIDGTLSFSSFSSQHFDGAASNPFTPAGFSWPARMDVRHQNELIHELQRLISLLRLRSSLYNVESRVGLDGKPYLMEVSPRGGGNRLCELIRHASGTDLIKRAIQAAIGAKIEPLSPPTYNGNWAEIILHSNREGNFLGLGINPSVSPYIIDKQLWVSPGQKIEGFKSANKSLGTLILKFPSPAVLEEHMAKIDQWLEVLVQTSNSAQLEGAHRAATPRGPTSTETHSPPNTAQCAS